MFVRHHIAYSFATKNCKLHAKVIAVLEMFSIIHTHTHTHTHTLLQVTTTLVSMSDTAMVDTNVDAVLRPLTEKEKEVQEEIERRFFKPLPQKHWEGVELREYWQTIKQDT